MMRLNRFMLVVLLICPVLTLAESFQAKNLFALVNHPQFSSYVSAVERENNVHLTGVRTENVGVWNLDFEGGSYPNFAKIVCLGSVLSEGAAEDFKFTPANCRIIRFD